MAQHKIVLAHDYICPWCWIAFHQAKALSAEFPVEFDWVGYELMPDALEWGEPGPEPPAPDPRKPVTPTRMELAYAASGVEAPKVERPKRMRSHNLLEAAEHAKVKGVFEPWNEKIYRSLWELGIEVNKPEFIAGLAEGIFEDIGELMAAIDERRYKDRIVPFDDEAYAAGVFNVPTYFIGGQKLAEQPLPVLRNAIREWLGNS